LQCPWAPSHSPQWALPQVCRHMDGSERNKKLNIFAKVEYLNCFSDIVGIRFDFI